MKKVKKNKTENKTTAAQLRAKNKYDNDHPFKTALDTSIRQARRLGNVGLKLENREPDKGNKLEMGIKEYPERYQESILDIYQLYGELVKKIKG